MKMIDKEEERKAEEQTPEGKKKKLLSTIGTIVFFVALGIAYYFLDHYHVFSGEPYPIRVENVTVIPGETTVQELLQAGYDLSDYEHREFMNDLMEYYYSEVIDSTAEADSHSYYPLILVKDGIAYAQVTVYNANDWMKKPLPECVVSKLEVMSFHENAQQAAILEIPFAEVTREAVSEKLGAEPERADSDRCVWKQGKYSLTFEAGDGESGRKISSEYELN